LDMNVRRAALSMAFLFLCHYVIDSGVFVTLWARHVQRAPQFEALRWNPGPWEDRTLEARNVSDAEALEAMVGTPAGLVTFTVVDQLLHLCSLVPVMYALMAK